MLVSAWYFENNQLIDFLIIASPIIVGGIIDDFRELGARSKLLFLFFSAGLLINSKYDLLLWAQWDQHIVITSVLTVFFAIGALCSNVGWVVVSDVSSIQKWSMLGSSTGVLLIIAYLVYRTEGQLGKHVSHFGRTLIETYVAVSRTSYNIPNSELNRAVVLDLFNYYKELQRLGLPKVVTFVKDVSGFLTFKFKGAKIMMLSSYSIAIICPEKDVWSKGELEGIKSDFLRLTDKHRATRLYNQDPEGLYFYNKDEFEILFKEMEKKSKISSQSEHKIAV